MFHYLSMVDLPLMLGPGLCHTHKVLAATSCYFMQSKKSSGVMSQPTESRAHGTITLMTYYRYFTTHKGHLFTMVVFAIFLLTEVFLHEWYNGDR